MRISDWSSDVCASDLTGGSIRWPSAANGVVGIKPTFGRVSRTGVAPLAASLDHVGPIARTVEDAAILLDAIAGYDAADPFSVPRSEEHTSELQSLMRSSYAVFRLKTNSYTKTL